jgi:isocitrate dehydrogenase
MFASAVARRGGAAALAAARRGVASTPQPITVAHGDGIGPEIMESTLAILQAAGANIKPEVIDIGEKLYLSGHTSGIAPSSWESLRRTKIFLKAPITTPLGGGYKSACVCGEGRMRGVGQRAGARAALSHSRARSS